MNNIPTKDILGHAFHLNSSHISNLTVKNAGYLGVKPEELNICKNTYLPSRPVGIYASEKPCQCNHYGKYFMQKTHLTNCEINHTGEKPVKSM
jgi:hypothetical protein